MFALMGGDEHRTQWITTGRTAPIHHHVYSGRNQNETFTHQAGLYSASRYSKITIHLHSNDESLHGVFLCRASSLAIALLARQASTNAEKNAYLAPQLGIETLDTFLASMCLRILHLRKEKNVLEYFFYKRHDLALAFAEQ